MDGERQVGPSWWSSSGVAAEEMARDYDDLKGMAESLLAANARLLARVGDLESVGAALEDAGNRLYAYIIKSNASGKEGKSAFFDVLEDGLQASRDFHDAQKQWQALAAHAAGAGDDGEGKDG